MKTFTETITRLFTYGERIEPARDWYILLVLFFLFFITGAIWNAWLFNRVQEGGMLSGRTVQTKSTFPSISLDAIEGIFEKRTEEEGKYTNGVYIFTDPSK